MSTPHRTRIGATTDSIALIASVNSRGVILAYDGPGIEDYLEAIGSRYLGDLGLDDAPDGLSIWEGHISTCGEYDAELCGSFRALTDAEWARLRETGTPWAYGPLRADEGEAIRDAEYASMRGALDVHPSNLPTVIDVLFDVLETERTAEQERAEQAERERDELRERYALVTRIRALQESQIDDLEARVRELEAALREIVAIDSASPEHRIAMRALGDSPAVTQTARLPAGCACGGEGWCDACQIAMSVSSHSGSAAGARCHRCGHYDRGDTGARKGVLR